MDITDTIRQLIFDISGECYLGGITVTVDDDEYCLKLDLNQWQAPLYITCQCSSDEEFLSFLRKEFKTRDWGRVTYYTGEQESPGMGNQFIVFDYGN